MRVLMINVVCGIRSTGRICTDLAKALEIQGHEVKIAYGREKVPEEYEKCAVRIGNQIAFYINALKARFFDNEGFNAYSQTRKFLKWADEYDPDLLWIHNLHGYYINVELLFNWIKKREKMKCKWTLHDCWAFTGHCTYFSEVSCDKWKSCCFDCVQHNEYPASIIKDSSKSNFEKKRALFTGIKDMTIITPSRWLADLVEKSFLGSYPIEINANTVDSLVFKPIESDFREKNGLESKKIILGVASTWDKRKGLDAFVKLSTILDEQYQIVLVGLSDKQIKFLPDGIIGLTKTNNTSELAKLYTMADCHVSLSKEETFGMTILEAYYCGTPSVVYEGTACAEVVDNIGRGISVPHDINAVKEAITTICQ